MSSDTNNSRLDFRNGLALPQPVRDAIRTVRREFSGCTEGEIESVAVSIAVSALQYEFGNSSDVIVARIAEELHAKRRADDDMAREKLSQSPTHTQSTAGLGDIIPLSIRKAV